MVLRPRVAFALLLAAVTGCGLKGPLYLPDTVTNVEIRPVPSATQPAEDKEKGDEEESSATAPSDAEDPGR